MSVRPGDRIIAIARIPSNGPFDPAVEVGTRGVVLEEGWAFGRPKARFEGHRDVIKFYLDQVKRA